MPKVRDTQESLPLDRLQLTTNGQVLLVDESGVAVRSYRYDDIDWDDSPSCRSCGEELIPWAGKDATCTRCSS